MTVWRDPETDSQRRSRPKAELPLFPEQVCTAIPHVRQASMAVEAAGKIAGLGGPTQSQETRKGAPSPSLSMPIRPADKIRQPKRQQIYSLFRNCIGIKFDSATLHRQFGSALRTRLSEINRDPNSEITIHNRTWMENGQDCSEYWSERRRV